MFKALDCPENTVYDPCFSGCPATCSSAASGQTCNATCQETCRCADGLVLDGGDCVDPSQCGCTLENDVYLKVCQWHWVHYFQSHNPDFLWDFCPKNLHLAHNVTVFSPFQNLLLLKYMYTQLCSWIFLLDWCNTCSLDLINFYLRGLKDSIKEKRNLV